MRNKHCQGGPMKQIKSNLGRFARARWLGIITIAILVAGFVTATTALMKSRPGKAEANKPSSGEIFKTPFIASQGKQTGDGRVTVGYSYHNDMSAPLRDMKPVLIKAREREENENPKIPHHHLDQPDGALQDQSLTLRSLLEPNMPGTILNFDGISFPGVVCNCAPPDTNGAVGGTLPNGGAGHYVQIVKEGYQVFDKNTGTSVLGPVGIATIWSGFGGLCETAGHGDPVVLYDKIANRWVVSQFAGSVPTDECIAVSTSSDATGSYNRYGFHLGSNFFDYPKLATWPD